ncbi:MAG: YqgE/AlgH family protein [Bacteroidota bacterium]
MHDENFQRTVVLLVEHNDKGSLGFVLNRRLKFNINEVVAEMPSMEAPVYLGGPVEQNSLHYVHRFGTSLAGSRHVIEDIYWGGDFAALKDNIRSGKLSQDDIVFFIGYAGWGPGQLDQELEKKSWIIAPEDHSFVFEKGGKEMWRKILKKMGAKYKIISNYPVDPRLN